MTNSRVMLLLLSAAMGVSTAASAAAPTALLNKSVVITWTESITEKGEDGRVMTHPANRERIAYISSTGRIFLRATNNLPGGQGVYENAPGASPAGSLAFQGSNTMVGTSVFSGFARRLTVNFGSGYSSCSASVVYGKSGGSRTWKSPDGKRTYEAIAISVGTTSCSIRDGNALAR
jgi:hypothetical protein